MRYWIGLKWGAIALIVIIMLALTVRVEKVEEPPPVKLQQLPPMPGNDHLPPPDTEPCGLHPDQWGCPM